jgi:hypothetical protein
MEKNLLCLLVFTVTSCASYREIQTSSPDFYSLRAGDIIWVYTGTVSRSRVIFKRIDGDSLFTDEKAYPIGKITRILKESPSAVKTSMLVGTASIVLWGGLIFGLVAVLEFYVKLMTLF